MRIIPKKLNGGFFPFFTLYKPITVPLLIGSTSGTSSRKKRSKSSDDDDDENDDLKKLLWKEMIKTNGLNNEMSLFVLNQASLMDLKALQGISDYDDLASSYITNIYQLKVMADNKDKYDKAMENALNNGALGEVALIGDSMAAQDNDGNLTTVTINDYKKNPDKYHLLTVQLLGYLRENDPDLIYNLSSFNIINSSVGYKSFQELVDKAALSIGSTEITRNGMFTNEGKASKGLELLKNLSNEDLQLLKGSVTLEGLYNYVVKDKSQIQLINAFTDYIIKLLPEEYKTWALLKTGLDKNEALKSLILEYFISGSNETHDFTTDFKGTIEHFTGKEKKEAAKKEEDTNETFLTAVLYGYGDFPETRTMNLGNNVNFTVSGSSYGGFLDTSNNNIANLTLLDLLILTGIQGITNTNSISFGNNYLLPSLLQYVAVENTGGFRAILPCIKNSDGRIEPNFELLESFGTVMEEINDELDNRNLSAEQRHSERNKLFKEKINNYPELQSLLNYSGELDESLLYPFFIVDGLVSDLNIALKNSNGTPIDSSNPYISTVNDDNEILYFNTITNLDTSSSGIFSWLLGNKKVYKSSIFIPIKTDNRLPGVLYSGLTPKDNLAKKILGESLIKEMNSNSPSLLNK